MAICLILNAIDGCILSDLGVGTTAKIEEERRLLYVATTRAKDRLFLMTPQSFYTHQQARQDDRHVYAARTRSIPKEMLGVFQMTTWPAAIVGARAPVNTLVRTDIGARMGAKWR